MLKDPSSVDLTLLSPYEIAGIKLYINDEFNCMGQYSDVAAENRTSHCLALKLDKKNELTIGAFKTPSLRGLANTAPYFHDGKIETLTGVLQHYLNSEKASNLSLSPLNKNLAQTKLAHKTRPLKLSKNEMRDLTAFLMALSE